MNSTQLEIASACDQIKDLLLSKNAKYGDSALNPCRVFSKADATEQILVRIDDKLNRIQKGAGLIASDEDVIQDLIGYLVLLQISIKRKYPESLYSEVVKDFVFTNQNQHGNNNYDRWDGTDVEPKFNIGNHVTDKAKRASVTDDLQKIYFMGERSPD